MCPLFVVSNRRPLAPAALPAFIATMGTSDFRQPPPSPSWVRLGSRVRATARRLPDLHGYPVLLIEARCGFTSRGRRCRLAFVACAAVACQRLETIGLPPCGHFGTFHLHGRLHPLPLHLASFRAYASSDASLPRLPGSIPDPWLAVIWAGFPPTGLHGMAMPQPRLDPIFPRGDVLGSEAERPNA